jgi:hypothetical protein
LLLITDIHYSHRYVLGNGIYAIGNRDLDFVSVVGAVILWVLIIRC